jgi:hypothetical protein
MFECSGRKPGERSRRLFVLVLVAAGLITLWLVAGTEIQALPWANYDDGLYVTLAQNILNGTWLGNYTTQTLIKVPFFPVFMAVCHIVSVPLPVAQELLYIGSCLLMLLGLRPVFPSRLSLLVIYLPLLFCPITLCATAPRDLLYTSLLLAMVACAFALILRCREPLRKVLWWVVGLGLSVALLWNTREEGVTVLPFLAFTSILIVIGNMGRASWCDARRAMFQLGRLAWIPILLFTCVNLLVCSLNYAKYGVFATNEEQTRSFKLAFGTLCGIDSDEKVRYVPLSLASLEKAYAVSPAAKELKPFMDGLETGWKKWGSELVAAEYANEYKGDWFKEAFRDAVNLAGHCKSWHDANDYYNRLYLELKDAFETGKLKGAGPRSASVLPVMSPEKYWKPVTKSFWKGLGFLMNFSIVCAPPSINEECGGLDYAGVQLFEQVTGSFAVKPNTMTGWAFCGGKPAGLEIVRPDGRIRNIEITRAPRPDVAQAFKGALTQDGRYGFSTGYMDGDKLRVLGSDGRTLALLEPISGNHFELMENSPAAAVIDSAIEHRTKLLGFKYSVHSKIAACYKMTIPWLECVSLVALALTLPLFRRKSVLWLYALVIAAVAAILPRLVALAIYDASTFPVTDQRFRAPQFALLLLALALPLAFVISNWRDIATRWHSIVTRRG